MGAGSKSRYIMDCDAGTDDAQALMMALTHGVPMMAVTCVFGNTTVDNVTRNVLRVLNVVSARQCFYTCVSFCSQGGGLCPGGLCQGDPHPHDNVRAVRILLECILVSNENSNLLELPN